MDAGSFEISRTFGTTAGPLICQVVVWVLELSGILRAGRALFFKLSDLAKELHTDHSGKLHVLRKLKNLVPFV